MSVTQFVFSSVDFDEPQQFSAELVLAHLSTPGNWVEGSLGPPKTESPFIAEYPFMNVEYHGPAGFSLLMFAAESSLGQLAATESRLSDPSVYVCLGGSVIEKWPRELFLPRHTAFEVLTQFTTNATRSPSVAWVCLDRFERVTVHPGGDGLLRLWDQLRATVGFPFAAD